MAPGQKLWSLGKYGKVAQVVEYRGKAYNRLIDTALDLKPGERVVDIGCGSGPSFPHLSDRVGPSGHVLGFDYNAEMIERARRRVEQAGWPNVEVLHADATEVELSGFDAAIASYSISATHDVRATMLRVHAALKPGGRLLVLDVRLEPKGWSAPLVRGLAAIYRRIAGWGGVQVHDAARELFSSVVIVGAKGQPVGDDLPGWPPLVNFVATK